MKHLHWDGNVIEALGRQAGLLKELEMIRAYSAATAKLASRVAEFKNDIGNDDNFIPKCGERYWRVCWFSLNGRDGALR